MSKTATGVVLLPWRAHNLGVGGSWVSSSPGTGRWSCDTFAAVCGGPWSTALLPGRLQLGCGHLGSAKALVPVHPLVLVHTRLSSAHLCPMCSVSAPVCRAPRCRKGANYDAASLLGGTQALEESHTLLNKEVSWVNSHMLGVGPGHVRVKWGSSPLEGIRGNLPEDGGQAGETSRKSWAGEGQSGAGERG